MPNRPGSNANYPDISQSEALHARADGLIPAHCQTLAKGPTQHVDGVAPKYLDRGQGCRVWDVDGNEYIDLTMAVGPLSLGYADPDVNRAITEQLERGIAFSLTVPLEVEVAELVRRVVPGADMVRYSKTGADVTSAAVRVARAYTGRERVVCCGYHGWHDWYIGTTPRNAGVPSAVRELIRGVPYNDADAARDAIDDSVACVILEPTIFEAPADNYLRELRKRCDETGSLLIFDEMWTGFRLALGGAQEAFDVRADLATFSKAVANGMPLSLLTGRSEVMKLLHEDVFFFTTFGGEALSLAAAKATIQKLRDRDVPTKLAATGKLFKDGYNRIANELEVSFTRCVGHDARSMVVFDDSAGDPLLLKSLVQQELIRDGVLWGGFHNVSLAHGEQDVEIVLAAYQRALGTLRDAVRADDVKSRLRGKPLQPVFRKTK